MEKVKGHTYKCSCFKSNNDFKELKMAPNDCLDNYLLVLLYIYMIDSIILIFCKTITCNLYIIKGE